MTRISAGGGSSTENVLNGSDGVGVEWRFFRPTLPLRNPSAPNHVLRILSQSSEAPSLTDPQANPTELPALGGRVALSVNAMDDKGVAAVQATVAQPDDSKETVNLSLVSGSPTNGRWEGSTDLPPNRTQHPTRYMASFTAIDADGRHSDSVDRSVIVEGDTTAPVISDVSVTPHALPSSGGPVTIRSTIREANGLQSAVAEVTFPNSSKQSIALTGSGDVFSTVFTVPANTTRKPQSYSVTVIATDQAGNAARSSASGITVAKKKSGKGRRQGVLEDEIILKPGANEPLRLRLLSSGGSQSGTATVFPFILNQPARIEAHLFSPTGKLLRRFNARAAQAGLNGLSWDGKLQSGAMAPRGVYVLQLLAASEEGRVAKVVETIVVR